MASFDAILDLMRPHLGLSAPDVSLRWAVLQAARKLCQEGRVLRLTIGIDTISGVSRYKASPGMAIPTSSDEATELLQQETCGIRAVEVNGEPYHPAFPWRYSSRSPPGSRFVVYAPDQFDIFPMPTSAIASGILVTAIMRPTPAAILLPSFLTSLYAEQIARGATAIMKYMPNEPWSDPNGAAAMNREFICDISIAKVHADQQDAPYGFRVQAYT